MSIVIGVDVAKYFSTYTFIHSNGTIIQQPFNADNDLIGLNSVLAKIKKVVSDSNDLPIIIMESTGYFSNRDFFYCRKIRVMKMLLILALIFPCNYFFSNYIINYQNIRSQLLEFYSFLIVCRKKTKTILLAQCLL